MGCGEPVAIQYMLRGQRSDNGGYILRTSMDLTDEHQGPPLGARISSSLAQTWGI